MNSKMPAPTFTIGDRVRYRSEREQDRRYFRRSLLRAEIKFWRRHASKGRLSQYAKADIRKALEIVDTAAYIEVAGLEPQEGCLLSLGFCAHECYLKGVPGASSPITYWMRLLFVNEAGVAIIPRIPMGSERCLEKLEDA